MDYGLEIQQGHLCPCPTELLSRSKQLKASVSFLQALERFARDPLDWWCIHPRQRSFMSERERERQKFTEMAQKKEPSHLSTKYKPIIQWEENLLSLFPFPFAHASTSQASVRAARERVRRKKDTLHLLLSTAQGKAVRPRTGMWRILMFKTSLEFCFLQRVDHSNY